jgi:hypothetical protein
MMVVTTSNLSKTIDDDIFYIIVSHFPKKANEQKKEASGREFQVQRSHNG